MTGPCDEPRAAYIHVPFCRHRCGYCDFPLIAGRDDLVDDYLRALEIELQTLESAREVDTLFFGGGTPTHLPAESLRQLLELTTRWFPLADRYELSVEANPLDLTCERVGVLRAAGVNRVSLGAQSFDAAALRVLERDHAPDDVREVIERLQAVGLDNIALDLIFAVPDQSLADWERTLQDVVALDIPHVSTYGLTWEKGTSFWKRRAAGDLQPLDDETERSMYAAGLDRLPAAGLAQYEISNFARPGFRCRHNEVYWRGATYFGFGPGAARYVEGVRATNHRSVTTWLKRVLAGDSGIDQSEKLDGEQRARELIMLSLRRTAGIDVRDFQQRTGFSLAALAGEALDRFLRNGLLEETGGHVRLTREGLFLADTVTAEFL